MEIRHRRLILLHDGEITTVWNGEIRSAVDGLASLILEGENSAYIAGTKLYQPLASLNHKMQDHVPGWRMRITTRKRHAYAKDGREIIGGKFFVDYIAIAYRIGNGHNGTIRRKTIRRFDVINLELFKEPAPISFKDKLEMSLALMELCERRGVKIRSTRGSTASALLKQSPKWEKGRHGAALFINQTARQELPGNFYSVSRKAKDRKLSHCFYVDQSSAHHNIARTIPLPHPHSIRARGHYKNLDLKRRWVDANSESGKLLRDGTHMGLVLAKIHVAIPAPSISHLYPPWCQTGGTHYVWLWTPEMRIIDKDHRLQLESFSAALTAIQRDDVLPEYADWSLRELARDKGRAGFKKGTLLSAYGMLAYNPAANSKVFRYWGGQNERERVQLPIAGLCAESRITLASFQSTLANVIARGMIESETRTRSIEYAKELHELGYHVAQIYADGLLVEADQLPFIREGWRVSHSLTHVSIPRPNAIISDQMTKLPGIADTDEIDRRWIEQRRSARTPVIRADRIEQVAA